MSMRNDLEDRIADRLRLWVKDSRELFDAGRLKHREAIEAIIAQLMYGATYMIARHMPPKIDPDFIEAFGRMLANAREVISEKSDDRKRVRNFLHGKKRNQSNDEEDDL